MDEATELAGDNLDKHDPNCYLDKGGWYEDEYSDYLWDTQNKIIVYKDSGEPEDMILCRNLDHFVKLLNDVAAENG